MASSHRGEGAETPPIEERDVTESEGGSEDALLGFGRDGINRRDVPVQGERRAQSSGRLGLRTVRLGEPSDVPPPPYSAYI